MSATAVDRRAADATRHLPGEVGVWVFILGDMLVFALFFVSFVYYRNQDVPLYQESQLTLNQGFGVINTLLMLSSSWFVALAMQAARSHRRALAPHLFALALLCGLGFALVKFFEYREKIRAGFTLTTNDFYTFYYMLTGIHLLHVLIGMGVLALLWHTARAPAERGAKVMLLESGASFWHLVDILWVMLFALLYLVK